MADSQPASQLASQRGGRARRAGGQRERERERLSAPKPGRKKEKREREGDVFIFDVTKKAGRVTRGGLGRRW